MTESEPIKKRSFFAVIFLSPDESRLRAGWRLLLQTILMIILALIAGIPLGLLGLFPSLEMTDQFVLALGQAVQLVAFTLSIYLARRFLDKRSFTSLGLKLDKWVLLDLLAGMVITLFMMGSIYLIMVTQGWLTFEGFAWQVDDLPTVLSSALGMLVIFILVGWNEELLSRGYHLQTIASGTNMFWGVLISSAVFGVAHLGNPNATWVSGVGILFAGFFLAYGYLATKQLWLPIGLHIGWNYFEGVVFGFPVSGLDIYPLTRITVSGPEIWTGGAFGPEAGLVLIPGLLVGTALIYAYTQLIRNQ